MSGGANQPGNSTVSASNMHVRTGSAKLNNPVRKKSGEKTTA